MPIKRLTAAAALLGTLVVAAPLQAESRIDLGPAVAHASMSLLGNLPIFDPAPMLAQSAVPAALPDRLAQAVPIAGADDASAAADSTRDGTGDLRKTLVALAMNLRDIRYVRGGHDPATGFDCSGFVRYVFAHAIGLQLPTNSAAQFLAGLKVKRADMQPGDLVFFHTRGKRRITHVGIYLDNGRFIHSPSRGKSVEVSSLDNAYWSKRFAGARRPEGIAQNG